MIEITAKLVRGSVYLSGETIECCLTFSNPLTAAHKVFQSNNDALQSLAWASAQIHCQCFTDAKVSKGTAVDENKSPQPSGRQPPPLTTSGSDTALTLGSATDSSGTIELATKPRILFCDLRLSPGETRSFVYRETVPSDGPPSYRGQLVKYSYKILVGTQRVNSPIKLLRVPFRVLPINASGLTEAMFCCGPCNDTTEELTPANPFSETTRREVTPLDMAMQTLQNITARRTPNFYMISNRRGRVGRFCLFKSAYRLGEDIVGTFDFSVASVRCVQVSVSLQCEEETKGTAGSHVRLVTYNKHHEVCLGLRYSQLVLPVPLHVTPAFATPLVTLRWRLHFEFVTTTSEELCPNTAAAEQPHGEEWQAPTDLPIETMVWSLPVRLFSTAPAQVCQGSGSNSTPSHTLLIR